MWIWTICPKWKACQQWDDARVLRDIATAKTTRVPLERGGFLVTIEHQKISGVTPEMLEWWFSLFPYLGVLLPSGRVVSAYQFWHPFDHRRIQVRRHSLSGQLGMAVGAHLDLESSWGKIPRKSSLLIQRMNTRGLAAQLIAGTCVIGIIEESFERITDGTRCTTSLILRSRRCLLPRPSRDRRFNPSVLNAWTKHKIEEIGNLERVVPQLYRSFEKSVNLNIHNS